MSAPTSPKRDLAETLLDVLPRQGQWTEEDYLWLTDRTNRLIEFTDGFLEILPVPTDKHQAIVEFMFLMLRAFIRPRGGRVRFATLRVRIRAGKFREPDVLLLKDAKDPRRQNRFWLGADLAVEVVSEDDPQRDIEEKRKDYAEAKFPEYWIINPLDTTVSVLVLSKKGYRKHGVFRRGDKATSVILPGFAVDVAEVFDAD